MKSTYWSNLVGSVISNAQVDAAGNAYDELKLIVPPGNDTGGKESHPVKKDKTVDKVTGGISVSQINDFITC